MKTATKNVFTKQQILETVAAYFPEAGISEVTPLPGGTFNTIYQISGSGLPHGRIILKTGPQKDAKVTGYEKNILKAEVQVYQMLQNKNLPIPAIYGVDFSGTLLPCDFFFLEWLEGKTWYDNWPILDRRLKQELGKYTARFHSIHGEKFGVIGSDETEQFDTWGEAFLLMMEKTLASIIRQGMSIDDKKIRECVLSRMDLLNEVQIPVFVDFDMWAGNVFVQKRKRYDITGIIDFERSFMGDPCASFVSALLLYENVEKQKDFLAGYCEEQGKELKFTDRDRERMILYQMLMYLQAYAESGRYPAWFGKLQRVAVRHYLNVFMRKLNRFTKSAKRAAYPKKYRKGEVV